MMSTANSISPYGYWISVAVLLVYSKICCTQDVPEFDCVAGRCYGSYVQNVTFITYESAVSLCEEQQATPAIIRDRETFDLVLGQVRALIPYTQSWTSVWIGMEFDPRTLQSTPVDGYWHWFPVHSRDRRMQIPWAYSRNVYRFTRVYIEVKRMKRSRHQGMINREPEYMTRGVVCEKLVDSRGKA